MKKKTTDKTLARVCSNLLQLILRRNETGAHDIAAERLFLKNQCF